MSGGAGQADLRLLLPLRKGDRALVLGDATPLTESLQVDGVRTLTLFAGPQAGDGPLAPGIPALEGGAAVDHVLIPRLSPGMADWLEERLPSLLTPGGWLLIGLGNAEALQRWRPSSRPHAARPLALSRRSYLRWLEGAGLRIEESYGVLDDLEHPRVLVPLAEAAVARYYFARMYVPHTALAALAWLAARSVIGIGLQRILFRDLVVVARRAADR